MKCALLISGQPRSVLQSYENIFEKIIDPNNCDVFTHSWIDPKMFGKQYYSQWLLKHREIYEPNIKTEPASSIVPDNIEELIVNLYKPKKFFFESPKIFKYNLILDNYKTPTIDPQDVLSQLYSMYSANQLRKQYEIENNIKYDVIIRIRFGMVFDSHIWPLSHFAGNTICFIPCGFSGFDNKQAFLNHISICDHFVISNSKGMDIYTDTFNQLEFLITNKYCHWQCEDAIGSWVRIVNKIPVALLDILYRINVK